MKSDRKPLSTVEELKARDRAADFLCDLARAARNEYADSCSRFILDCFSDKDIMQRILDLFSYHNVKALLEGRRRDLKLDPLTNANKGAPGLYVLWDLFIGDTPCEYIGKAVQVGRRVLRQHLDPSYREEAQASFQLYDPEVDWTRVKHGVLLNLSSPINVVFSDDTVKKILMLAEAVVSIVSGELLAAPSPTPFVFEQAIQLGGFYRHGRRAIINIYTLHMLTAQAAEFEKQSHGGSRGINSR